MGSQAKSAAPPKGSSSGSDLKLQMDHKEMSEARGRLISVNVGRPRLMTWAGQTFSSGIFKTPVEARVTLGRTNLDGDRQADLSVHGGPDKTVYGYPLEHYAYWKERLPGWELPWGALGENFTTEGLLETDLSVGDRYRVGSAVIMVKTPRLPCFKLAAKFRRDEIIEELIASGYSGFYFSVVEEGEVGAGDEFEFLRGETPTLTVLEAFRLYLPDSADVDLLQRAVEVAALPESWRERYRNKLAALEKERQI
jgi:MOSC domain-containing protein YiiM